VAEHGPGRRATDLLHVAAAETTAENAHAEARPGRVGKLDELLEPVGIEYDRAHRLIVGGTRGRFVN